MKKILLSGLLITGMSAVAQTPRLSLYEEFTGENCPPCASTNPGLNILLASPTNTPKVVAIKWQVPIPSAPSATWSLYQTNKTEIDWRWKTGAGNYGYSPAINSAPSSKIDGQEATVFGAASGHPANLNNSVISSAQSFTSAFSVTMNRAWDATYSAVNLTISVTASANFTAVGSLVFRTVMVERHIHFATQPGTNGEKDFEDAAIRSFPTLQAGVPMAGTWTIGQTQTFTLNCPLPSYTRDKSEVAFVGFIQDDGNQKVAQAVRADKQALANDAKAVYAKGPAFDCATSFTPEISLENKGNNAITALTITPYVDGVAMPLFNWAGSLAVGATNTITLAGITPAFPGGHVFNYDISSVAGGDFNLLNNQATTNLYLASGSVAGTVVTQPFATTTFPPVPFGVVNPNEGVTWARHATANGISITGGTGAAKMDFWSSVTGEVDDLLLPPMSFTATAAPTLSFDVAYAQYALGDADQLDVFVSDDCGVNWTNVFSKSGALLSTTGTTIGTLFTPTSAQWRKEAITLTGYNNSNLIVKFTSTSDFGNNLYLDNINLSQVANPLNLAGINTLNYDNVSVTLYPNPSNGQTNVVIGSTKAGKATISMMNALGQVVFTKQVNVETGSNNIQLDVKDLASGIYNVVVATENGSTVKKLTVSK